MNQLEDSPPSPPSAQRETRRLLLKVAALAVVAFGLRFAIDAVLAPWAFFMGGDFHLNPRWAGWGRMHSNTSGDYAIYLTISPSLGRGHSFTDVTGTGALCTQRGDNYRLSMAGSFGQGWNADLQGRTATLYPHNYVPRHTGHYHPSLEFRGAWNNPDLVLDDQGSINQEFNPDGTFADRNQAHSAIKEKVPLTLHQGSRSDFNAACAVLKTK